MPVVHPPLRAALRHLAAGLTASVLAVLLAVTVASSPAEAYSPRVVIIVGPAGASTGDYLRHARDYAAIARAHGATVIKVFHPRATWKRVVRAAQGANVLIYLGHGNGWPSPYSPFQGLTKNGLGLNPHAGAGAGRVKYYGETMLRKHIRLAPGAIVLLNRLCYASGNGEPGFAEPSWSTAIKRVDNYGAGFLRTGASTVLADGHTSLDAELRALFNRNQTIVDMWRSDPDANGHVRSTGSKRTGGVRLRLDPDRSGAGFYRSLATRGTPRTIRIRTAAYWGRARRTLVVHTAPRVGASAVTRLGANARFVVRGRLTRDDRGRTWAPVMTRTGRRGWVAAWRSDFSGAAKARTSIVLRARHSTQSARVGRVHDGSRVRILRASHDSRDRVWLKVRTPSGRTGWIAAWLTTT